MIGFYNYSVIVTYLGVALSVTGMALACSGRYEFAILCLALAGACDTFDGKIARAMKNRTRDMVCFGVTPAVIAYHMGLNSAWGIAIEIIFVLCGAIRLAFFNVLEELKHMEPQKNEKKYYRGLPITTITIIFPITYLFHPLVSHEIFTVILALMLLIVAFLYIFDFKIKKPGNGAITVMMIFVAIVMLRVLNII